jgi:hypothetical protein
MDYPTHLSVADFKALDLFDDIPYKYLVYNGWNNDDNDDDIINVEIEDLPYDREGWCMTQFKFVIREPYVCPCCRNIGCSKEDMPRHEDGTPDYNYQEFVVQKKYREGSQYEWMLSELDDVLDARQDREASDNEDDDEDEDEKEEETLTMNKIMQVILFNNDIYERTPWASHIKHKICGNKEMAKQVKIIADLSLQACNNKDIELWNRMDKKRKEIVYKIMDNLEDVKNDISDNEYLKVCNYCNIITP